MRTARHKVPRPRQGERVRSFFCTLAPVRGRGMRRVGEANAKPTRRRVRGNFHITPTLTPTLSQREREFRWVPSPPSGGEGQGEGAHKGESPN